jgi:hypothetical protein
MSLNDEANVQSNVRHVIARAEPIEDQEATEEHRSSKVLRRKPPSNRHMSVHDWRA